MNPSLDFVSSVAAQRRRDAILAWSFLAVGVVFSGIGCVYFWKTFVFLLLLVLILCCAMTRPIKVSCSLFSGLPYGKMAPVVMAKKPWWHLILNPLPPEMRDLWTGLVREKSLTTFDPIGRVRIVLVGEMWYLQTVDPKFSWASNVRVPLASPIWRTCYTCPADQSVQIGEVMYPPSSSTGAWKYVAGLTERKKAENTTLHMEIEVSSMKAWFDRRRPPGAAEKKENERERKARHEKKAHRLSGADHKRALRKF